MFSHVLICLFLSIGSFSLLSVLDRIGGCPVCLHPFNRSDIIDLGKASTPVMQTPVKTPKGATEEPQSLDTWHSSAKLDAVLSTLRDVLEDPSRKVVIFSQWTHMLVRVPFCFIISIETYH